MPEEKKHQSLNFLHHPPPTIFPSMLVHRTEDTGSLTYDVLFRKQSPIAGVLRGKHIVARNQRGFHRTRRHHEMCHRTELQEQPKQEQRTDRTACIQRIIGPTTNDTAVFPPKCLGAHDLTINVRLKYQAV